MLVNNLIYFILALVTSASVIAQDDAWHLDYVYTLANEELDPIVSPNAQSSHMHKIIGGSRMAAYYNYNDYAAAKCSSLRVQADKSNYWMPNIYVISNSTNGTTMYTPVSAKSRFYYFLSRSTANEAVTPFPKGLRILTGNPNNKAPTIVATFTCQVNADLSNTIVADNFNFDRDCPYGMKTELYFPPCWDGKNLYKSDGSHMAYPSQNVRSGRCPWTHPVRLPHIQLEYTWHVFNVGPGLPLNGRLAWANGDTTGYGIHGDFVNGWDMDVLKRAMNDSTCVGIKKAIPMQECLTLNNYFDDAAAAACTPELGTLVEPYGNVDNAAVPVLPGCNRLWGASGLKPTCSPPVAGLDVSKFKGNDGPYIAEDDERRDFVLPTTPGWKNIACLHDITSISGGVSYTDSSITTTSCQSHCLTAGYQYAATGQQATVWNCVCGTAISDTATVETDMCLTPCPGNSSQLCGGSYIYNVFYAPPGTTNSNSTNVAPDGSTYVGCYNNPSDVSTGLLGASTYNFQSNSMTTETCISACAQKGTNWALTTSQRWCYCGNDWNYGSGAITSSAQCTVPCTGNSSEICGDYYRSSVYNITSALVGNSSAAHLAGYQGCYQDTGSRLGMTSNSWTSSTMTQSQCINGCSELGYSYAGIFGGNQCYCGKPNSNLVSLPASQCQSACAGRSNTTCGGSAAMDLYTVAAATVTSETVASQKPSGYVGCFKDQGSNAAFTSTVYTYKSSSMTPDVCKQACLEFGYTYAGLENANECHCGKNFPASQQMVSSLYCTASCPGSSSQTCGAAGYLEGYSLANTTSTISKPSGWLGCYSDSSNSRTLQGYSYSASSMTSKVCRTTCGNKGFSLSAVEYGTQCFCGNSLSGGTQAPASSCSMACSGNSSETCGAAGYLDLFNTTGVSAVSNGIAGYIGCYTDYSVLDGASYSSDWLSVDSCNQWCYARGAAYGSVRNGNTCKCSSKAPSTLTTTTSCNNPCSGDSTQQCGTSGAVAVYQISATNIKSGDFVVSSNSSGYVGCYKEGSSRLLPSYSFTSNSMTNNLCVTNCKSLGYAFAGTENGNECYCSAKLNATSGGYRAQDSDCSTACKGGGGNCGAGGALSVWATANVTIPSTIEGLKGCYATGSFISSASLSYSGSYMTTDLCRRTCRTGGYSVAGLTNANTCGCSNSTNYGAEQAPTTCNAVCNGNSSQTCGATYSSAVSVFDTTGAGAQTPSGYPNNYIGCISDGNPRTLPDFSYKNSAMTSELCRQQAVANGYSLYGTEYSTECYAAKNRPNVPLLPDSYCSSTCGGSSTEKCGNGGRLSYYAIQGGVSAAQVSNAAASVGASSSVAASSTSQASSAASSSVVSSSSTSKAASTTSPAVLSTSRASSSSAAASTSRTSTSSSSSSSAAAAASTSPASSAAVSTSSSASVTRRSLPSTDLNVRDLSRVVHQPRGWYIRA
ncbi:transmembrane receptor [Cryptococcus gattii E566]|uniref:Transmembrane receptor n=1 Tax=Cryptococcus gattii EJB2 TaxID=1296103 RepID=A0ABR5BV74_9TREE|nr:transmembrane receptor [Cryptococcus gattii EJB2]KIY37273.1 transmembrane receptor [Cryptococcus gattii E566]KJE01195.1 transmembrane receptor [Cryptococcus gattii NT-10]